MPSFRYVLLERAAAETGYTVNALRQKIKTGAWLQGREWVKAPDGRILVDVERFNAWVAGETTSGPAAGADRPASGRGAHAA